jgi:hypothetical protein
MSKRIIIPKENFFETNALTRKYGTRFRLTNENRSRFSYWSPIFFIDPGFDFITSGEVLIEKHTGYSIVIWNPVSIEKDSSLVSELPSYDLWVRWGTAATDGTWQYEKRISTTSISVLKPTSPGGIDHLSIEIYRPAKPILRKATYDVDQSNSGGKINLTTDVITLPANVFLTGYPIRYRSVDALGGLTDNVIYYARMLTPTTMTLHPTANDAINNTNKIDITSHKNSVGFFTWEDCTVCDLLLYSKYNFSPV